MVNLVTEKIGWIKGWIGRVGMGLLESIFTLFFTFLPIVLIALTHSLDNHEKTFLNSFFGYWKSGEIVLPILGLCGYIWAIIITRYPKEKRGWIYLLITFTFTAFSVYMLGFYEGFEKPLPSVLINIFWGMYIFLWISSVFLIAFSEPPSLRLNKVPDHQRILDESKRFND